MSASSAVVAPQALAGTAGTIAGHPKRAPVKVYDSPAGEAALSAHYDEVLAALPFPTQSRFVDTRDGRAHVLVAGAEAGRALVVWHGKGFPGAHMMSLCGKLVEAGYRVYLPDEPCDAGSRSDPIPVDPANHGWGRWALDVLQGLGLTSAAPGAADAAAGTPPAPVHMGMSFGGAVTLDLMAVAPHAVGAAALIVPISVHPEFGSTKATLKMIWQVLLPILLYMAWPCMLTQRWACDRLMGDWRVLPKQLPLTWRHLRYAAMGPPVFRPGQLDGFDGPALALLAEFDIFGDGHTTATAAKKLIPGCEAHVLPMKHAPTAAQMDGCVDRVIAFLADKRLGPKI